MDEVESIFNQLLEVEGFNKRWKLAQRVCGADLVLLAKIERFLHLQEEAERRFPSVPGRACSETVPTLLDESVLTEGPGTQFGRYKLLEKLGQGGFGSVWVAEQRTPVRRRVAFKVIKLGMDTEQVVARFEAERQALAMMDHPNIAKIFDAGATNSGRPYFVMELVKGIAITKYCDQEKLNTQSRLDLFIKVCQALQHAHQKGVIHRDIKASNVMVTLHDGIPVPKVIDFGIAKATQQELTEKTIYTQYNQFIGTPAYMSPEQAEMSGLDIDTRSDIYSLGVLLYELLTGSTPLDAKELLQSGLDEMRKIIREREPVKPSTKLRGTSTNTETHSFSSRPSTLASDLDWIVMKCLEKDRARRYDTANALAMDLKRHMNNEPVTARPPTKSYRFQKAFRRNRLVFTSAAVVAAALMIGIGVSVRQTFVARKAQRDTEMARSGEEWQRREAQQKQADAEAAREAEYAARMAAEYASYISQIGLTAANLDQNNPRTAQDALLATLPEYRNWEWGHLVERAWPPEIDQENWAIRTLEPGVSVAEFWRSAAARAVVNLPIQNSRRVNAAVFRKNGRQVLTSPNDGKIHVWDGRSGKKIKVFEVTEDLILALALNQADALIATGHTRGGVSLLDAETGVIRWTYRAPTRKPVDSVWFSPDGRYLLVGYFGSAIDVLDAKSGGLVTHFDGHAKVAGFTERSKELDSLHFLADGSSVITASTDGSVRVWDLQSGRELKPPQFAPDVGNKGISIQAINSADSREVATGDFDGAIYIWDRMTGLKTHDLGRGIGEITHLFFSHDGTCLFVVERDQRIRILNRSGIELASIHSSHQFFKVELDQSNGRILTTSGGGRSRIWTPVHLDSNPAIQLSRAHTDVVVQATFSRDGDRIVTSSFDTTAKVWDTASQSLISVFEGHTNEVIKADFSPDGQRIASVSLLGEFRISEAASGRELFLQPAGSDRFLKSIVGLRNGLRGIFLEYTAGFSSSPFSPSSSDPKLVISSDQGMLVRDGLDGSELLSLRESGDVGWPVISPSGDLVAVMTDESDFIQVWDLNTGDLKFALEGHQGKTFWASFSNDSSRIATGSMDGTSIIWDAGSGKPLVTLRGQKGFVTIARFDPDGDRVVTAANDHKSIVWNVETGDILSTLTGPEQRISNVEFNPNPGIDRILTTSVDNTVRIWDATGSMAHELLRITRDSKLTCATWSPDGRAILTGWSDGVVQLYETIPWEDFAHVTDPLEMGNQIQQWRVTRGN